MRRSLADGPDARAVGIGRDRGARAGLSCQAVVSWRSDLPRMGRACGGEHGKGRNRRCATRSSHWPEIRALTCGCRSRSRPRKIDGVDPLPVLLDVLRFSQGDPLIPQIVWQNLHPIVEDRQEELARWLEPFRGKEIGFSPLVPHVIERLLASPKADARIAARLLYSSSQEDATREALDLLAEGFRERSMPAELNDSLRKELSIVAARAGRAPRRPSRRRLRGSRGILRRPREPRGSASDRSIEFVRR